MKSHYSARQFARLIGKNNRTVTLWIKKGLIPGVKKVGRDYRIPSKELDKALTRETYPDPTI
jgi:excisionase family DNA binding protein